MEKLKPGIRIYSDKDTGTIQINSGIIHHSKQVPNEIIFKNEKFIQYYEPEAHLPKRDWRKLDTEEHNIIAGNHQNKKDYNSVFTGEIPDPVKDLFRKLNLHTAHSEEEVLDKLDRKSTRLNSSHWE